MGQLLSILFGELDFNFQKVPCCIHENIKYSNKEKNFDLNSDNHSDNQSSLANIAKEFEFLQEKAMKFGLNSLVDPIKDTVDSLKDLNFSRTSSSIHQESSKLQKCSCRIWGPDSLTPEGEWVCVCGHQCQCDKVDWVSMPYIPQDLNSRSVDSLNSKPYEIKIKSPCEGKCETSVFPCKCNCHSLEVKGKGSCLVSDIVTSSEDDPTTRSREEIANVEKSNSLTSNTSIDDRNTQHSNNEEEKEEDNGKNKVEDEVKEVQGSNKIKKTKSKTELTCPCGCEYIPQGEIKICLCGCGQMFEIIDDLEKISYGMESRGTCCNCTSHVPGDCLKNVSKLSLDKFNNSGLMTTIELLQIKCRVKDGLIAVLAERLKNSNDIDDIVQNLTSPQLPEINIDFDRSLLYEFLKQQTFSEPPSEEQLTQHDSVPAPKNFRVVKSILQSVYLAWDLPDELSNIRGYEILVNGVVTRRVSSAKRSQTVLTLLNLTKPTELTLYSVATNGYTSEPLRITYPAHKSIQNLS